MHTTSAVPNHRTINRRTKLAALVMALVATSGSLAAAEELPAIESAFNPIDFLTAIFNQHYEEFPEFNLGQPSKVYTTYIDQYFDLFDRFLEGFRATVFSPNAMRCSQRLRAAGLAFNTTFVNYLNPKGGYDAYVFNFTKVVSTSGADAFGECYTTGYNVFSYIMMRSAQFPDFVGALTAFLQNMIGNILNFNTIYQNIVNANNAGKMTDVYFYIGRLSYLIVYFDPIVDSPRLSTEPKFDLEEFLMATPTYTNKDPSTVITIIYDLPISFLNGSIGISSPNSTVCLGNLSSLNSSLTTLMLQFNLGLYDKMGDTIKRMIQAFDPISYACFYSGFEYYQILLDYVYTIIDVNKLVYNIFHNAGKIYDAVTDLIENFRFNDPAYRSYWQRIGGDIGLVVNQISYKPTNYDPKKL